MHSNNRTSDMHVTQKLKPNYFVFFHCLREIWTKECKNFILIPDAHNELYSLVKGSI